MADLSEATLNNQAVTQEQWFAASKAERAAMFPLSQQSDVATNHLLQRCGQFAKDNPSLALTLMYLAMSLMGLLFQTALLFRFGLNVLPYLEISDFLLAALTHPEVVAVLAFMVLVVVALITFERWFRSRSFRYALSTESSFQRWWVPQPALWISLLFLTYLIMAAWSNGNSFAKDIRAGKGSKLEITLIYPLQQQAQKVMTLQSASLISRTASYLFIYHDGKVKVLPHANVAAILPELEQDTPATKPATLPTAAAAVSETVVSDKSVADQTVFATVPKANSQGSVVPQTATEQRPSQTKPVQNDTAPAVKDEKNYQ